MYLRKSTPVWGIIMTQEYFVPESASVVLSNRIIYTPSVFARDSLFYLQEVGALTAIKPHTSCRYNLHSYLCFLVNTGTGTLEYKKITYHLSEGDVVFIDCQKGYCHSTGNIESCDLPTVKKAICSVDNKNNLWTLQWCHFYGSAVASIYDKYLKRGGETVFHSDNPSVFEDLFHQLENVASSEDYIRDMKINVLLASLLECLMSYSWNPKSSVCARERQELHIIKSYIDENYAKKITLQILANQFFLDKSYLCKIYKEQYGVSLNRYISEKRITEAKRLLRFSNMTMEQIGDKVGYEDGNYFSRVFKKLEGCSPREYRKNW